MLLNFLINYLKRSANQEEQIKIASDKITLNLKIVEKYNFIHW